VCSDLSWSSVNPSPSPIGEGFFVDNQRFMKFPELIPQLYGIQQLKITAKKNYFLLAIKSQSVIIIYMKARDIKIRKPILFTKARPHKLKNKIIHRKLKHKKTLIY
jgi:hypothetical protein